MLGSTTANVQLEWGCNPASACAADVTAGAASASKACAAVLLAAIAAHHAPEVPCLPSAHVALLK